MAIYGIRKKRERLSLLRSDECHPSVKKKQKIDTVVKIAAWGGGGGGGAKRTSAHARCLRLSFIFLPVVDNVDYRKIDVNDVIFLWKVARLLDLKVLVDA